jgi:hypothetical protein
MTHNEPNLTTVTVVSGIVAVFAGLTINEIAASIGIVVALSTFGINFYFQWRRDRRERLAFEYRYGIKEDRRMDDCARCDLMRRANDGGEQP